MALRWPGPGCWKCGAHVCSTTSRGVARPPYEALQPTRQSSACARARTGGRACVCESQWVRGAVRAAVRDAERGLRAHTHVFKMIQHEYVKYVKY